MNITQDTKEYYDMLIQSASNIGKIAENEGLQADLNATLSCKVIEAIKSENFHKLIRPKSFGGPQINFATFVDIIKTVGYYNLSAAWLTYFFSLHNSWAAFLPLNRQKEIYESDGLLADIFAPVGKLERVEGGFILNGKYHFVSGIKYSEWVAVGALYVNEQNIQQRMGAIVHSSQFEIIEDWDSIGLRGSGSNTLIIKDIFVPEDLILNFDEIALKRKPSFSVPDDDYLYYNVPFFSAFFMGFAAMAIGGAERAIDEFKKHTKSRVRLSGEAEKTSPRSQRIVASVSIKLLTAKSLMDRYIKMLEEDAGQYHPAEYKMIRSEIIKICLGIATETEVSLGASALLKGHPNEMIVRDMIAIAAHVTSLYEDAIDAYGKYLSDIPTNVQG